MAKTFEVAVVVTAALCVSTILSVYAAEEFYVEGRVYCDTCRVAFETPLSHPLIGAKVNLECRNETTNKVTLTTHAVTKEGGVYTIVVDDDHEDDVCIVSLLESSDSECSELIEGVVHDDHVALTNKNGITGVDRYANPLGFATKEALPNCTRVLLEMGVLPPSLMELEN